MIVSISGSPELVQPLCVNASIKSLRAEVLKSWEQNAHQSQHHNHIYVHIQGSLRVHLRNDATIADGVLSGKWGEIDTQKIKRAKLNKKL